MLLLGPDSRRLTERGRLAGVGHRRFPDVNSVWFGRPIDSGHVIVATRDVVGQ